MTIFCEHGNEPLDSVRVGDFWLAKHRQFFFIQACSLCSWQIKMFHSCVRDSVCSMKGNVAGL